MHIMGKLFRSSVILHEVLRDKTSFCKTVRILCAATVRSSIIREIAVLSISFTRLTR
jgi:hypothetical protein